MVITGFEPGTCGLVGEDLKLAIQSYVLNGSSYIMKLEQKPESVANKQKKATIIVLNATLSMLQYKIVVCSGFSRVLYYDGCFHPPMTYILVLYMFQLHSSLLSSQ